MGQTHTYGTDTHIWDRHTHMGQTHTHGTDTHMGQTHIVGQTHKVGQTHTHMGQTHIGQIYAKTFLFEHQSRPKYFSQLPQCQGSP